MYGLVQSAPKLEPVTLTEAKLQCRVVDTTEDALLTTLIAAARQWFEEQTGRALITRTVQLRLDAFPSGDEEIFLPLPPFQKIKAITYVDLAGVTQTLDEDGYQVTTGREPAVLTPVYGQVWPIAAYGTTDAVMVEYDTGYGDAAANVPDLIKAAIRLLIGAWFEHREEMVAGAEVKAIPHGAAAIAALYALGDDLTPYGACED